LCLESASQNKDGQKVDIARQKEKAQALRAMHHGPRVLVLPNAFDAMSARIFEETGFRAIATASAGIAFSLGYPDGEVVSRHEMLEAVRRIACAVSVPVSADMESGFADDARGVADTVKAVIEAGAVGINLEDTIHHGGGGFYDISTAVERIKAAKEAALRPACRLWLTPAPMVSCTAAASPARCSTRLCAALTRTVTPEQTVST
jgi:2-methylisocitrate lyase-like PEP mutase family enzyme